MNLTHAVIIRLCFNPDDPRWPWRKAFFEAMCLPHLLKQTDQNFDIWLRCHPAHSTELAAMHPKIKPFTDISREEDCYFGADVVAVENSLLPQFDIQTRLDSDDLVRPQFIERIHAEIAKQPDKALVVSFQPTKFDLWNWRFYRHNVQYHERRCSMCQSLYQPDKTDYQHIYDFRHSQIWRSFPNVVMIPEGYCLLTIHDQNIFSTMGEEECILTALSSG